MHKSKMDRKKKNEDDQDVIDFMELVEENLANNEKSKIEACEDLTSNDLFENKPLQDNEINSSNAEEEDNSSMQEFKKSENINKELNNLNEKIEKMACDIVETKELETDKEPLPSKIQQDQENTIYNESSKQLENASFDKINLIHSESLTNEFQNNRKNSTKQANNTNLQPYKPDSHALVKHSNLLGDVDENSIKIKKYPGYLYINIYAIEKYISSNTDVQSIFIQMKTKDFTYETDDYAEDVNIKINSMFNIKINSFDTIDMKFILNKRTEKKVIKSSECCVTIDKSFINKLHNTLYEVNYEWSPYSSNGFFRNIINFFSNEMADALNLKLFFSFISEEELKLINLSVPNTLYNLGKWLKIRKYAYNTWFSGFCNIRGFNIKICTHLWKRRFIKVHGYKVLIFNEHTKHLLGAFDLLLTMTNNREIIDEDNKFKIINDNTMIEFHFDCNEKYFSFRRVMQALL
ncbi:hypothetical protein NCER_100155 [Vairimorpha ceranae BRL01]|uniref:Uncharacterized protein n=2 Tax=Vairimorpha ceranae TaxID=40302 RepID=C4V6V8_VAIC1|nr:hypothetical protein NCER_100155 [Vairimorpha ceranae BRL01]